MAITKARSAEPVRGYYVTTIYNGRTYKVSGHGFGLARLGGLTYARVEGLASGGTAAGRMLVAAHEETPRQAELGKAAAVEEEKIRVHDHEEYKKARAETAKAEYEAYTKGEEARKKMAAEAKKEKAKADSVPKLDVVHDPNTGTDRLTARDHVDPAKLDDPREIAKAEKKSVAQQAAESTPSAEVPKATPAAPDKK